MHFTTASLLALALALGVKATAVPEVVRSEASPDAIYVCGMNSCRDLSSYLCTDSSQCASQAPYTICCFLAADPPPGGKLTRDHIEGMITARGARLINM